MEKIKKILVALIILIFPISNFTNVLCESIVAEKNENEIESENESSEYIKNLKVQSCINFVNEKKINVKIYLINSNQVVDLNSLDLEVDFDSDVFKFVKKHFNLSNVFKTKSQKIDSENKESSVRKVNFTMKKGQNLVVESNSKKEIINFDLDIKKNADKEKTNIYFNISLNNTSMEEFSSEIIIPQNKLKEEHKKKEKEETKIENIKILNLDTDLKFDQNIETYDLYVSNDTKAVNFETEENINGVKNIKNIEIPIDSNRTKTLKIGKYKIKISKEKPKIEKSNRKKFKIKKSKKKNKLEETKKYKTYKSKRANTKSLKKLKTQKRVKKLKKPKKHVTRRANKKLKLKNLKKLKKRKKIKKLNKPKKLRKFKKLKKIKKSKKIKKLGILRKSKKKLKKLKTNKKQRKLNKKSKKSNFTTKNHSKPKKYYSSSSNKKIQIYTNSKKCENNDRYEESEDFENFEEDEDFEESEELENTKNSKNIPNESNNYDKIKLCIGSSLVTLVLLFLLSKIKYMLNIFKKKRSVQK